MFEKGTEGADWEKVPWWTGALEKAGAGLLLWIIPLECENDPPALIDGPLEFEDELPPLWLEAETLACVPPPL